MSIKSIYDAFTESMSQKADMPDNPAYRLPECPRCHATPEIFQGRRSGLFWAMHKETCLTGKLTVYGNSRENLIQKWKASVQ